MHAPSSAAASLLQARLAVRTSPTAMAFFGLRSFGLRALGAGVAGGFLQSHALCGKLEAQVHAKEEAERRRQLDAAIEWTLEHGHKTGRPATKLVDEKGKSVWPLASEGSINRRPSVDRLTSTTRSRSTRR